jgi:hypothetical protein
MLRIGLIPLDERPVNTRYPAMLAAVAGAEIVQPPGELLSHRRTPADPDRLAGWLRDHAGELDALIVSLELFAHGGLIASRTTGDTAAAVLSRLAALAELRQRQPALYVSAFNVITRVSNSDDSFEEPLYWATYGSRIYRYSQLLDRQLQGQEVAAELDALRSELPPEHLADFLKRRLRNHTVNLATLELLAAGVFDRLVIASDDTSEYGLGSREKRWLAEWADILPGLIDRLLLYPGADEVGSALLARLLNDRAGITPAFAPVYAIPGDEEIIAPFEDGPVRVTIERQVRAVGGLLAREDEADFIVAVNTPSPARSRVYDFALAESERAYRQPHLGPFVERIRAWVEAGRRVIVADVAYPNGADPVLVELLCERVELPRLAAYGAWNTAGNTTGVALAQGVAAAHSPDEINREAQTRFLLHRFVEDWGYQHVVRSRLEARLLAETGSKAIPLEQLSAVKAGIENGLQDCLEQLPGFAGGWRIAPGSVRLPWDRTFEVDFDLERRA